MVRIGRTLWAKGDSRHYTFAKKVVFDRTAGPLLKARVEAAMTKLIP